MTQAKKHLMTVAAAKKAAAKTAPASSGNSSPWLRFTRYRITEKGRRT